MGNSETVNRLIACLKDVTDVLDHFGDLDDSLMSESVWIEAKAWQKVKIARELLSELGIEE